MKRTAQFVLALIALFAAGPSHASPKPLSAKVNSAAVRMANGQSGTAHSISLSWTASTTANAATEVTRSTSPTGTYTVIADAGMATTFTDTTVSQSGGTYCYEVVAYLTDVNGNKVLSPPSNDACGTIPPNADTGLTVTGTK